MEITGLIHEVNLNLNNLFPKENYKKNRAEVLHYLILYDQPLITIQKWIDSQEKNTSDSCLTYRAVSRLSPLDLCALLNRCAIAQSILSKEANFFAPDPFGKTPLHYAVLMHGEQSDIFRILVSAALKTHLTVEKLLKGQDRAYLNLVPMTTKHLPLNSDPVFLYWNEEGKIVQGTAEKFKELTKAEFSDQIIFEPAQIIREWLSVPLEGSESLFASNLLSKEYVKYLQSPPKLYLKKDPGTSSEVGFGVRAGQKMTRGTVICHYSGVFGLDPKDLSEDHYRLEKVSARDSRNLASMINHSFPNAIFFPFYHAHGGILTYLIIAIENIEEGEEICVSYSRKHSIVVDENHIELRKAARDQFIQQTTPRTVYEKYVAAAKQNLGKFDSIQDYLAHGASRDHLTYFFHDVYAFIRLLELNKADNKYLEDLMTLLDDPKFQLFVDIHTNSLYSTFLVGLCYFFVSEQKISTEVLEKIKNIAHMDIVLESTDSL